jgi:integrase/recombinase XerD
VVLDRLTTDGLDRPTGVAGSKTAVSAGSFDAVFNQYYAARMTAGAAERTLMDYTKHYAWLRRFLRDRLSGLDNVVPNRELIRDWIMHMQTFQRLNPSTVNIRLRTMKALFNWATLEGVVTENPFTNVELLRVPEEDFPVITPAQEWKLLSECDLSTLTGLRDALLVSFLLNTGVRIGECLSIDATDVSLQEKTVTVRGGITKTRKARTVFFGNRTQQLLSAYGRRDT